MFKSGYKHEKSFVVVVVLVVACQLLLVANATGQTNNSLALNGPIRGTYDVLYVEKNDILQIRGKHIFQYFVDSTGKLTLHGWDAMGLVGRTFSDAPAIKLLNGLPTNINFGNNSYFGDVVLQKRGLRKIRKRIKKFAKDAPCFIAFVPMKDDKHQQFVTYKIVVTKDNPRTTPIGDIKVLGRDVKPDPDVFMNPSPPRQFH